MVGATRRVRPAVPDDLVEVVDRFWYAENPAANGFERKLPTGALQIIVNLDGDQLTGLDAATLSRYRAPSGIGAVGAPASAMIIDLAGQRRAFGISLRPAAAGRCAGAGSADASAPLTDLIETWGPSAGFLRDRLLEQDDPAGMARVAARFLRARLSAQSPIAPAVTQAVRRLDRGERISVISERVGVSQATLTRWFRREVGLTPKTYQRIARLQRALAMAAAEHRGRGPDSVLDTVPGWAGIAAACGYSDQSHLTHDFVDLAGLTPGRYRPRDAHSRNHVPLTAANPDHPTI